MDCLNIVRDNYIRQLIDLFHCCEDLDDVDGLHQLYAIFKSIFMLNKTTLLETLFSTDIIMDVVGVLEYDPMLSEPVLHREFLTTGSKLRQVIFSVSSAKPKFHYTDFVTKSTTLSRTHIMKVHDTNHVADFPHALNGLNSIRATQTGLVTDLSQTLSQTSRYIKMFCVRDFPHREVLVKVGITEFELCQVMEIWMWNMKANLTVVLL